MGLRIFFIFIYELFAGTTLYIILLYIPEKEEEKNLKKVKEKKAQRTKSHSITHANFFMHILIYGGRQENSTPHFQPIFPSPY